MRAGAERTRIVVVGGVAGGASAAARARRCDEHAEIIVFEKGPHVSFANCGLPYFVGGEIERRDSLLVAKPEFLRERFRLDVRTRHEVVSIDRAAKVCVVDDSSAREGAGAGAGAGPRRFEVAYDKLILSPGAEPVVPALPGVAEALSQGVAFTIRNLEDTDRLMARLAGLLGPGGGATRRPRAVVVGAGFIGLEMAEQLARRGAEVTLAEAAREVLPALDAEVALVLRRELEAQGVRVHTGDALAAIEHDVGPGLAGMKETGGAGRARVRLASGRVLDADVVILGIGVRPNTALARACGLTLDASGAIAVDAFMRTSDPAIYAVGDAVAYRHAVTGRPVRAALGGPANRAGRLAGEHAATGRARPMAGVLGTAIVRAFGVTAGVTGLTETAAAREGFAAKAAIVPANDHAGYYPGAQRLILKLVYEVGTGRVLGAQAVGGRGVDKRLDVVATALSLGASVWDLAGLDLAYAPPFGSAKDPVHLAAFVACNDLEGSDVTVSPDAELAGAQVVDVRTAAEFEGVRIAGARHIRLEELRGRAGELDASRPVVCVCQAGLRGHVAARILRQHGFADVRNLTGGMLLRELCKPAEVERGPVR